MDQKSILIVEDEQIAAMDLKETLKSLGYRVAGIAGSGERAVEMVDEQVPDLILMDINLGAGMNGIDAAKKKFSRGTAPRSSMSLHTRIPNWLTGPRRPGRTGTSSSHTMSAASAPRSRSRSISLGLTRISGRNTRRWPDGSRPGPRNLQRQTRRSRQARRNSARSSTLPMMPSTCTRLTIVVCRDRSLT